MSVANIKTIIPSQSSQAADWITFYDALPFARNDKNALFMHYWKLRGSDSANTKALVDHLKENGLDLKTGTIVEIQQAVSGVVGTVASYFKIGETVVLVTGGAILIFTGVMLWRLLTPESVGIIAGQAVKTVL